MTAPPSEETGSAVFISYSRKDKDFVHKLDDGLKKRGREAWVDWEDIHPAEEFMQAIYSAIEGANAVIFVVTPDSVASKVCSLELAHAARHNKRLIPVIARHVEDSEVPEALAKLNWICCREDDDFEKALDQLIAALDTDLEWVHAHTRLLTRALEWQAKGKNNSFALRGDDLREAEQWLTESGSGKEPKPTVLQTAYIIASRNAATQIQRKIIAGVSLFALVAVVLAIIAAVEKRHATAAAGRATRARESAEQLVGYMIKDLREKLEPVGRLHLLNEVNQGVKRYFDRLKKEDETPGSQAQRALMANNYGAVLFAQGNTAEALQSYRAGLAIRETLLASEPHNPNYEFEVAESHRLIAGPVAQSDLGEAIKEFRVALDMLKEALQHHPEDNLWQEELSSCYNGMGDIQDWQGDADEAMESYNKARAITENLLQAEPTNSSWQRDLSGTYKRIANVRGEQGDLIEAINSYRESLAISKTLAESDPSNAQRQFDLAVSHGYLGVALQNAGVHAEATEEFLVYREIMENLARQDPGNAIWQRELSVTYNRVGDMQAVEGDVAGALKSYQANLAIAQSLVARDAANASWQRDLGVSYNKVGEVLFAQKDFGKALENFQRSLAIAEELIARDPDHARWQLDMAFSRRKIGDVQRMQGDIDGALESYNKTLAIAQKLLSQRPKNTDYLYEVATTRSFLGMAWQAAGEKSEALDEYETYRKQMEELVKEDANANWQRDLSLSYNDVGDILNAQGKREEALARYNQGLTIAQTIARQDPSNILRQRHLSSTYQRLGYVQAVLGKTDDALTSYRASAAPLEELSRAYPKNYSWEEELILIYWNTGKLCLQRKPPAKAEAREQMEKACERIRQAEARSGASEGMRQWLVDIQTEVSRIK